MDRRRDGQPHRPTEVAASHWPEHALWSAPWVLGARGGVGQDVATQGEYSNAPAQYREADTAAGRECPTQQHMVGFAQYECGRGAPDTIVAPPSAHSRKHASVQEIFGSDSNEWELARWLRVGAFFVMMFIVVGLQYTYGVFLAAFVQEFPDTSITLLAAVGSISTGVMEMTAVVGGYSIHRFGESETCFIGGCVAALALFAASFSTQVWHLVLTYGVLLGAGHSLSLFSGVVLLNKVFVKRRALASGIGSSGNGVGALVFGAALPPLIEAAGVWGALRVLAAVTLLISAVAAALFTVPGEGGGVVGRLRAATRAVTEGWRGSGGGGGQPEAVKSVGVVRPPPATWLEVLRNRDAAAAYAATAVAAFGLWVPTVYLVRLAQDRGHEGPPATMLVSYLGIGGLALRVPTTYLADLLGQRRVVAALLYVYGAICIAARWLADSYAGLVFLAVMSGWLVGSFMSLLGPTMAEIVAPRLMPRSTTLAFTLLGTGFMAGPAIAGEIYVASGDLAWSFVFAGAVQLVGALTLTASIVRGGRAARARAAPDGAEKRGPAAELGLGVPPDARAPAPAHPRAVYLPLVLSASEVPVAPVLPFMFAVHRPSSDSSGVQERPDAGALGGTGGV